MAIKFLNTVQVDTDVLYVNTANDRVGIGTTSPAVTLHVDGFARLNGGLQMNATNAQIYQILDSDLRFGTNNTERMRIDNTGNVGIGTTSPGAKLHVSGGNLLFDAQYGVRFVDGNTRIYTNSDSPEDLIIEADQDLLLNPDRNVGIGTTSPSEKLEVAGKVFINGQIYGGFGSKTTSGTLDWDDSTNARSGNGHTLLRGNATNGPAGAEYYHPFSWEYASYDNDGNMTQFAIPYSTNNTGMYYRSRYNGTWTDWAEIVTTTKTLPGGPYLPLAGGTMTGNTLHGDGVKSMYGAGNDLQIYHNGSNSLIEQSGTGKLILDTTSTGINIQSGVGETRFTKSGASSEIKVDDASQVNKVVLRASGNSSLNGVTSGSGLLLQTTN